MDEEKKDAFEPEKLVNSIKEVLPENLLENIKKVLPTTYVGFGLIVVFIIFCFVNNYQIAIRWWVMLPTACVSIYCLYYSYGKTSGLERKYCIIGIWIMVLLYIIRDSVMSHEISALVDELRRWGVF